LSAFSKDELSFTTLFELPPVFLGRGGEFLMRLPVKSLELESVFKQKLFYPVQMRKKFETIGANTENTDSMFDVHIVTLSL
jgi:hypothetical protein